MTKMKVTIKNRDLYKYDEIRKEWVFVRKLDNLRECKIVADAFHYVSVFEAGV